MTEPLSRGEQIVREEIERSMESALRGCRIVDAILEPVERRRLLMNVEPEGSG